MKSDILTVSFLFLVIILLSIWFSGTPAYVPYSATIYSQHSNFEGFSPQGYALEYTDVSNHSALDGTIMDYIIKGDKSSC